MEESFAQLEDAMEEFVKYVKRVIQKEKNHLKQNNLNI